MISLHIFILSQSCYEIKNSYQTNSCCSIIKDESFCNPLFDNYEKKCCNMNEIIATNPPFIHGGDLVDIIQGNFDLITGYELYDVKKGEFKINDTSVLMFSPLEIPFGNNTNAAYTFESEQVAYEIAYQIGIDLGDFFPNIIMEMFKYNLKHVYLDGQPKQYETAIIIMDGLTGDIPISPYAALIASRGYLVIDPYIASNRYYFGGNTLENVVGDSINPNGVISEITKTNDMLDYYSNIVVELVKFVKKNTQAQKVLLLGHSIGSVTSRLVVDKLYSEGNNDNTIDGILVLDAYTDTMYSLEMTPYLKTPVDVPTFFTYESNLYHEFYDKNFQPHVSVNNIYSPNTTYVFNNVNNFVKVIDNIIGLRRKNDDYYARHVDTGAIAFVLGQSFLDFYFPIPLNTSKHSYNDVLNDVLTIIKKIENRDTEYFENYDQKKFTDFVTT